MASVANDKNGTRRVLFVGANKKRKTIRLGRVPAKYAETFARRVESLVTAQIMREAPDDETARWVARQEDAIHAKLAAVGLVKPRGSMLLGPFLESYVAMRSDVKGSTATVYGHTKRCLIEFFGEEKPLREISEGDADEWRLWLADKQQLADNTIRRRCGIAKQFFRTAQRKRLIEANPFTDLKASLTRNAERHYFVTAAEAEAVLKACPDSQWRLLFALARYGGLRVPSEPLALRWGDIDWERGRMTVTSPKTEHHEGKGTRVVPIFPELMPYIQEAWDQSAEGDEFLITRYRDTNANLRTQLGKIIKRAGVVQWPKLFQNLRASRETELCKKYPLHVVCDWIGNSAAVAAKHYLQTTEQDFEAATEGACTLAGNPSVEAAQNAAQYGAVTPGMEQSKKSENPVFTGVYRNVPKCTSKQVGDTGLEPVTPAM